LCLEDSIVRSCRGLVALLALVVLVQPAFADFPVFFGSSWDGISLQSILDAEYGAGAIDVLTQYEGYLPGDADPPYWEDATLHGVIVREIAGFQNANVLGWYQETFAAPTIDGFNDGVVFSGPMGQGAVAQLNFPGGVTRFGFYLNPNGSGDSANAPEPEKFFTNRAFNDIGPSGAGATYHGPDDGDPQCLIYNITHLREGVPTYVLAWEDLDSGGELSLVFASGKTDNDFNDLVVEVSAQSPVPTQSTSFGTVKALYRD
jgi:hypothetical protein